MKALYPEFSLTLMVNHACNLRCVYCYTGSKFHSPMPQEVGDAAIERAFRSVQDGGRVTLGFFGGEPLIETRSITRWMEFARGQAGSLGKEARFTLTTNGTIQTEGAWQVMLASDLELAVSFDGSPTLHNRQRPDALGRRTTEVVEKLLCRLRDSGKIFRVVCVVRPDNLDEIPEGLVYLHDLGVREIDLSLDLWTPWSAEDGVRLKALVENASVLWREWLPEFSLNWFDSKTARLARLPESEASLRCGFGAGEIAVAPSGRLYPCERLIGEDKPGQPMALLGHVLEGEDFLSGDPAPCSQCSACSKCALRDTCDTLCRCSNYIRTGNVNRPDGLLCILNKAVTEAVVRVLGRESPHPAHTFRP